NIEIIRTHIRQIGYFSRVTAEKKEFIYDKPMCLYTCIFEKLLRYLTNYNKLSYKMTITSTFRALNDETRRAILELLKNGELSGGDISKEFDISNPSISHHLVLLKQADLIKARKRGQLNYYSL